MKYNITLHNPDVKLADNLFANYWFYLSLGVINEELTPFFSSVYHHFDLIENIIENITDELLLDVYDELD